MKITKLITGGVLVVMAIVVMVQFKFDSFIQALLGYADLGATASVLLAIALLIAGAIYIICNSSTSILPPIISFIILILGGVMGIFNAARFPGLMLWSWAAIIIGLVMAIVTIVLDYFFEPAVDQYGNAHSNSYYENTNQYPNTNTVTNNMQPTNYSNNSNNFQAPQSPLNNFSQQPANAHLDNHSAPTNNLEQMNPQAGFDYNNAQPPHVSNSNTTYSNSDNLNPNNNPYQAPFNNQYPPVNNESANYPTSQQPNQYTQAPPSNYYTPDTTNQTPQTASNNNGSPSNNYPNPQPYNPNLNMPNNNTQMPQYPNSNPIRPPYKRQFKAGSRSHVANDYQHDSKS